MAPAGLGPAVRHARAAASLLLAVATGVSAAAVPCSGRFVLARATGTIVQAPGDVVVLDGTGALLDPACGSAPLEVRAHRRVSARWKRCRGHRVLRATLRASADCTLLRGTIAASGRRPSRVVAYASRCGDAIVDPGAGERCDDGNALTGDGCDLDCGRCVDPATFASTWESIETNVFARTCVACHGASATAGLDLRPSGLYERIVGAPVAGGLELVAPGVREGSLVWRKLAKATFGGRDDVAGGGMPFGSPLPADAVEAVGRWIDAGAPREGIVPGTDALFGPCR